MPDVYMKQNGGRPLSLKTFRHWYLELVGIDPNEIYISICTEMVWTHWYQIWVISHLESRITKLLYGVTWAARGSVPSSRKALVPSRRQRPRARPIEKTYQAVWGWSGWGEGPWGRCASGPKREISSPPAQLVYESYLDKINVDPPDKIILEL